MTNKKNLFNISESEVSEDEPEENKPVRDPINDLYNENFNKYVNYLKEFSEKIEETEEKVFGDGIWYVNHPLIELTQINYEKNVGIFDCIDTESEQKNMEVNSLSYKKMLIIFTYIDNEIEKIISILDLDLYDSLLMYGEESETKPEALKESPEIMTSRMFQVYKKIYDLVRKLMAYIENIIIQLHSMINKKSPNFKTLWKGLDFSNAFDLLGKALRSIYIIDTIVSHNNLIGQHLELYKKMLKLAGNQPEKFGTTKKHVRKLEKSLSRFQSTILSKSCMLTVTEITFDEMLQKSNNPLGKIQKNKELRQIFEIYFINKIKQINESLGSRYELDDQKRCFELMCAFTLFRKLYPEEELKDVYRDLWLMQKKMPIIEARGFVCIYVCVFLLKVCPLSKRPRSLEPKDQNLFIAQYLATIEETLSLEIVSNYTKFCVWLSRMESVATSNSALKDIDKKKQKGVQIIHERLSNRIYMLCEGFNNIMKLNKLLYGCFILHAYEQKNISKALLGKLILGIETVKATAYIIRKKVEAFDTMILAKTIAKDIVIILNPYYEKSRIEESKKSKEYTHKHKLLVFILKMLESPINELKITYLKYALNLITEWIIADSEFKHIRGLLKKLEIVSYNTILIQKYQKFNYLYYMKGILPNIFQYKRENPNTCKRLQFLFDGFEDPSNLIKKCVHLTNPEELYLDYKKSLLTKFEEHYMLPLKRKLEDFLRINVSAMLIQKLQGVKPFMGELNDLIKVVQVEKIRIFDHIVDMKVQITNSFNYSFYNLNILNMHDMETYEIMRIMGNHIFDLKLHDVFLPNQTIEQNKFDILQVVRNINSFVTDYKYNILSQRFLEITKDNKIIACISIHQLSDSIKTHGLGIISTTVNSFYIYLKSKVQAFSKFLFMDQIQNPFVKEKKWFKSYMETEDYPGHYPYERAQFVYKEIKKVGKFQEDSNYLDKLRELITTVGNSLGFIRLLRSASLNTESKNIEYLPRKVQITETFEEIANKSTLSEMSKFSCKELDDILKHFQDKFSDKIDYLNLMVKAFSKINSKDSKHLNNFFMMIPALSINYAEYVTRGKEQINKKISSKAFIYDDGFVLGLQYFITLLKQHQHYRTLHWDQATNFYFDEAKKQSKAAAIDSANHSAKFIEDQNLQKQLLFRKLEFMEEEFKFFSYNMISAKVLFKGSAENEAKEVPKSPPSGA